VIKQPTNNLTNSKLPISFVSSMSLRSKWIGLTAVLILSNSGYVSPVIVRSLCGSFFMSCAVSSFYSFFVLLSGLSVGVLAAVQRISYIEPRTMLIPIGILCLPSWSGVGPALKRSNASSSLWEFCLLLICLLCG
jgi:hypothetical protein